MNAENTRMLELAAEHLGELVAEVVFVGGATVELWITDEAAPEFRPTDDIDVIVEIATTRDYYRFEERVREVGFENDLESGVICRFKEPRSGLLLDVMPSVVSIVGFENHWQATSFPHAVELALPSGRTIQAIPPPFLMATKLEAFATRGENDFYGSRDFGDVIALIDSREELLAELALAPEDLQTFVAKRLREITRHPNFASGAEGALAAGPQAQERLDQVVMPRIEDLAARRG